MYRVLAGALACAAATAGTVPANASSLTSLPAVSHDATRSIVTVGDAPPVVVTKSILAVGEQAIPQDAAATPGKRRRPAWVAHGMPTVMRGGVVGEPYEKADNAKADDAAVASSETQPPRQPQ